MDRRVEGMEFGGDDDEEIDAEALGHEQVETEAWKAFSQGQMLMAGPEEGDATFEGWEVFVRRWIDKADESIGGTEELRCLLCAADPTMPQSTFTPVFTKQGVNRLSGWKYKVPTWTA